MRISCNKSNLPLGGILAVEYYKLLKKDVQLVWSDESVVTLPNAKKPLPYGTSSDLIRILENAFNKSAEPLQKLSLNHWLSLSLVLDDEAPKSLEYLDKTLGPLTFLVGESLSVADLAVFAVVHVSAKYKEASKTNSFKNIARWLKLIEAQPCVAMALKELPSGALETLAKASSRLSPQRTETSSGRQQEGKFVELPNAEMGKVVVRFPPEASGYLHIGHAKAALLNQYYQQAFEGKLIMRFDDTNPAKENAEFEKVILEDVEMLEIKPDLFTHTSQYFDLMLEYCEKLMKEGKAFVDDTAAEQMKTEREQKVESKNRNNSVEKNLQLWAEMQKASDIGVQCCVRAKIDMQSANGCLRDPTIYRCKPEVHPRTGTKYKVYPTYDFACPIVDSIEGVTHVLRTMEYHDRDPQFYWFIDAIGLRKPYIWEYSRLSMTYTLLSKRKLTWFVDQGLVDGWDDPRMPTVRGVLRRGMTVEGLRQFITAQGSSRSVVFMEWDKIWAINKKVIDPVAPRYTALETSPVPVNLKGGINGTISVPLHPKNPAVGTKTVRVSTRLLIDQVDAKALKEGENATFINYGNILIDKVHKSPDGTVTSIDATPNIDNKDFKKTIKLTWLADTPKSPALEVYCVYFEHIISKALLGKDEDFKNFIGHKTRWEIPMLGEPDLAAVKKGDIIQLQRRGFFKVDVAAAPPSQYTGKATPLVLFHVPDGHTKEMPGQPKAEATSVKQPAGKAAGKPGASASDLSAQVAKQGEVVRSLKSAKAAKASVEEAVKILLDLKARFKAATGQDWTPNVKVGAPQGDNKLYEQVAAQGEAVRALKAAKAAKPQVEEAVKVLLELKAQYKATTGQDWSPLTHPNTKPAAKPAAIPAQPEESAESKELSALNIKIAKQGAKVRSLKAGKGDKDKVNEAVKLLLELKARFKEITGQEWKPEATPVKAESGASGASSFGVGNIRHTLEMMRKLDATHRRQTAQAGELKVGSPIIGENDLDEITRLCPQIMSMDQRRRAQRMAKGMGNIRLTLEMMRILDASQRRRAAQAGFLKVSSPFIGENDIDEITRSCPQIMSMDQRRRAQRMAKVDEQRMLDSKQTSQLLVQIANQGDKVRKVKAQKAEKSVVDVEVKNLLNLKDQYKSITGTEWTPNLASSAAKPTSAQQPAASASVMNGAGDKAAALGDQVSRQGDLVRELKTKKADKAAIDEAVKKLLELKAQYLSETGTAYAPPAPPRDNKAKEAKPKEAKKEAKPKEAKPKEKKEPKAKEPSPKPAKEESTSGVKKVTRLGLEASKETDLSEWYSQVITKSEMIDYYDISGCYILRPWSYSIWEKIRMFLSAEFKKLGVKDGYFPIFVSKAVLEREKTHIADFAPEVAWVTHSGSSELAEHIAIRPTSETVMYPAYARWIQSHRDLPYKLNQWNNVVRWEFKQPQPFLRTREFLWQEGHTAYRFQEEAAAEVMQILDLYAAVYEDMLAVPVIKGRKTEKEKFAGGDWTTTVEAYVPASGRGIQGATSHHLGQNFSKMFEVVYDDPDTHEKAYVYQNSWGLTTRTIGVMVLVHGDDRGLVLPPRIADIQTIVVPCGITVNSSADERKQLIDSCKALVDELVSAGIRAEGDYRDNYSPGWKFNHWELKGVPIRVELGPKDMAKGEVVAVRRLTGDKRTLTRAGAPAALLTLLEETHNEMLAKATKERDARLSHVTKWEDFTAALENKHIIMAPFCNDIPCEDQIKNDSARTDDDPNVDVKAPAMGAKSLCIPFKQPRELTAEDRCIHPACKNKPKFIALFGRSY